MTSPDLTTILETQLATAWAGEADTDPPRLGWWRTAMVDEFGGHDLLQRIAPRTWEWAALDAARGAARRVDARARARTDDADGVVTLFRLGFEIDEEVDELLLRMKQEQTPLCEAMPRLAKLIAGGWEADRFALWLPKAEETVYTKTPTGRRMRDVAPEAPVERVMKLASALTPFQETYPLPHYRIRR
jgi:hypothetical protein